MASVSLIGREPELGLLGDWIRGLVGGAGGVVLLEGEPGIGKSALLAAAREEAAAAGCAVYWGTAEELGELFPLLPLLTAFSVKLPHSDPAAAAEALVAHIDQVCVRSPVVLVVDDLHWADPATVAMCHRLARSAEQRPLLLIGALRSLPRRDDLDALRRAAGRARCLRLGPLPPAGAAELVASLAGGAPSPGLAKIAADAAGNPLYLTELVDALRRSGALTVDAGTARLAESAVAAPATVNEAIRDRLDFLPEQARPILRVAALLGGEFQVGDLAAVTGRNVVELVPVLSDAQAVEVLSASADRLAFRHPLIRAALYDELAAPMRRAWHREAAQALRGAGAPAPVVARQLLPAMAGLPDEEVFVSPWVTDWLLEAAPALVGQAAEAAGALLHEAAKRLPVRDRRRHVLTVHLARALVYQAAYEHVETLIAATLPHVTDPDLLVDLYDAMLLARQARRVRFGATLAELDRVIEMRPELPERARLRLHVLASRARAQMASGNLAVLSAQARATLDTALALGDAWSIGWMCNVLACSLWLDGEVRQPLELLDQGLAATADDPGLLDPHLVMLGNRGIFEGDLDLFERAKATLTRARRLAEETGKLGRAAQSQKAIAQLYFDHGQWDDALAETQLPDTVDASNLFQAQSITAVILFHRGDLTTARAHLAAAQRLAPQLEDQGQWALTEAVAREAAGDPRAALDVLAAGLADAEGLLDIEQWLADAVRLATDLGDTKTAATATAQAQALATGARQLPRRAAVAAHCQGIRRGDPDLLLHAAHGYGEIGRPLPQAQALEAAAGLLADAGDTTAARPPFHAALEAYERLGAEWNITQLRARFRKHHLRPPVRRLSRPTTGWEALTTTETKIADLVARGRSNPEIANELAVTRRTVETHVTNILAKLQLRSRIDIVRAAR